MRRVARSQFHSLGIGSRCALDKRYSIDCNSSIPYLSAFDNTEVLNISLAQQTITVNVSMTFDCQNRVWNSSQLLISTINPGSSVTPFLFSRLHNIFVVERCGNAVIKDVDGTTIAGCSATCRNDTLMDINNCFGIRCCQANLPYYLEQFMLNLTDMERLGGDGTCGGSAFLVDKNLFLNGSFSSQFNDGHRYSVPISLFWPLTLMYEHDVPFFESPECTRLAIWLGDGSFDGYVNCGCNISDEGNPYLPNGCKKHEECKRCEHDGGVCSRLISGIYEVTSQPISIPSCDLRYRPKSSLGVILGVRISNGILFLAAVTYALYNIIRKSIDKRRKEKFFKRNGGLLLKQQESIDTPITDKTILFTSQELETATEHLNENRILGRGGQCTIYKGMLTDGRIVAIKKSKVVDESQIDLKRHVNTYHLMFHMSLV